MLTYSAFFTCCIFFSQTSDPTSGFATVEKDVPGSLTPMLGDKKVSQSLNHSSPAHRCIYEAYVSL